MASRLMAALEMWEDGVQIMRENLRRRAPRATNQEIETELARWLAGADVVTPAPVIVEPLESAAEPFTVTRLSQTLRAVVSAFPDRRTLALVGDLAVSVRTEPSFMWRLDFAIAVESDADAKSAVFSLQGCGFTIARTIDHATRHRLAAARLRQDDRAPSVNLLFVSCGVEREIVGSASPLEVLGVTVDVATVGHLIAMKLVSRDARRRPRDQQDLVELAKVADALEWQRAEAAIELIRQRGFSRGRDLQAGLAEIRALSGD